MMKKSNKIDLYKKKIIELADKLLEKEKECSHLSALKSVHEMRIESLEKQLKDDKRYKDLIEHIAQQDNKITSLIKQRDNYKNDYEYAEECFQAERSRRWELEEQLNKIKNIVKDKNEFYEKCPLKVLHVDTENDTIKSKYTLDCFEILDALHDCYQLFYLQDKINGRSVDFACICGSLVSTKEFELFDQFLDEEILMIERCVDKLNKEYKRYYIDLREFKFYETEFKLRNARKQKKNG
jgi:hypothetical protein